jgi:ligand-binding sensor domain-containing protein
VSIPRTAGFPAAILVLAAALPARAVGPSKGIDQYSHAAWQEKDGLPSDFVGAILQTSDGYLWFGTLNGLARFDGVRFTNFDPAGASAPLLHRISWLHEARDGSLWIGSRRGLTRYRQGRFDSFPIPDGFRLTGIRRIVDDGAGRVWARTATDLFVVDGDRMRFVAAGVRGLARGADGRVRVATVEGLGRIDGERVAIERPVPALRGEPRPLAAADVVLQEDDGSAWIGASWGLGRLDARGSWTVFGAAQGLPGPTVTALARDRHGGLWVGTTAGLARWTDGRVATAPGHALSGVRVLAVHEDRDGNLWVGTDTAGVHQLRDGPFTPLTTRQGLSDDLVRPILESRDGTIWIGTARGLDRVRGGRIDVFSRRHGLPADAVHALAEDAQGRLWVGTEHGLARFDPARGRAFPVTGLPIAAAAVLAVAEDRDGGLWVGTSQHGVVRISSGRVVHLTRETGLSDDHVSRVHQRPDGSVWLATDAGITVWRDGRLTTFGTRDGLPSSQVRAFHEAGDSLWIGTYGGGLCRFHEGRFDTLPPAAGLPDSVVYDILEDRTGHVWMTSNRGIIRVARDALARLYTHGPAASSPFTLYTVSDGLQTSTTVGNFQPASWASSDGRLWFPTRRGAVWVDPARTLTPPDPPRAIVESVVLDGRPQSPGLPATAPPGRGDVAIEYTAPWFRSPGSLRFQYRLDGLDDDWRDAADRRTAHYANVPPGRYTFRVAAVTPGGVGPEAPAVPIELRPHFHQTAWFYALCVLAAGAATWGLYRARLRRLRSGFAAVLAERSRIAREMHDALDQGLTAIGLQLDVCTRLAGQPASAEALRGRVGLVKELLDYTRTEARRSIADLRSESLEAGDLAGALRRVADQFTAAAKLKVNVTVAGKMRPLPGAVEGHLLRICQEAVTNAVRHGRAGEVAIGLAFDPEAVRLTVADQGCGFDPLQAASESDGHFGLMGIRERVKKLGGRLQLASEPGRGTTVSVEVPARAADA